MKKTKFFAAIIAASALTLSGCFPSGETELGEDVDPPFSPDLKYELTLPKEYPSNVNKIKAEFFKWDDEKLKSVFIGDKKIVNSLKDVDDPTMPNYRYYEIEDARLFCYDGCCQFRYTDIYGSIRLSLESMHGDIYLKEYFPDEELEDFPKEDAVKAASELFEQIGVKNYYPEPEIFAIPADKAEKLWYDKYGITDAENEEDNKRIPPLTKDFDFYMLEYRLNYDNIPTSFISAEVAGLQPRTAKITIMVDKTGIRSFTANNFISEKYEAIENVDVKTTPAQALNALNSYFALSEEDFSPTTVYSCRLVYITSWEHNSTALTLTPAWEFLMSMKIKEISDPLMGYVYVNPTTGNLYMSY